MQRRLIPAIAAMAMIVAHVQPTPSFAITLADLFDRVVSYPAGGPYSVAVADVNADGRSDLITASLASSPDVSVLLGNGDGTFGPQTGFGSGHYPYSVAVADFNSDSKLDLVVAGQAGVLSMMLGYGNGTFGSNITIGPGVNVATADFNLDGMPDLVVSQTSQSVLLGNGDGTFTSVPGSPTVYSPTIADLNADGVPDLSWATGDNVVVALGNGDGTFGNNYGPFDVSPGANSVAVGDLNGDGDPDLAVTHWYKETIHPLYTYYNKVTVLLGAGDGNFASIGDFTTAEGPQSAAIADFDGDGKLDVATGNSRALGHGGPVQPRMSVLLGNGDGTLQPALNSSTGNGLSIVTADLDGDGKPDLAFSNSGVTVMLATDTVAPTVTLTSPAGGESWDANTVHNITWNASDNIAVTAIDLELSTDGGATYPTTIASDQPNTGSYAWTTPGVLTSEARIKITAHDAHPNAAQAVSPNFTINAYLGAPSSPFEFAVSARPNPLTAGGTIEMAVAREAKVRLSLLDVQGREVQRFASGVYSAGRYPLRWDGRVANGLYFLRYETPDRVMVQRLTVMR